MPESYVIFITEADFFGDGVGVHHFARIDKEFNLLFGDGTHILYANASYEANDSLGDLMHDFLCSDPADMRTEALAKRSRYLKEDAEGVSQMCEIMDEIRAEGVEEGREEGLTEGLLKGTANTLASLVSDKLLSLDVAASRLGVSAEEFAAQAEALGYKLA